MAIDLNFDTGGNALLISPNTNGVYSVCNGNINGLMGTDSLAGEDIDSVTVIENTITVANINFDSNPPSFPYTVNYFNPTIFSFDIIPSGTVGNSDTIEFQINIVGGGTYTFLYDITELDIQNSITIANNTLPIDFGTIEVGNSSSPSFVINNETCIRYNYTWYSDNPEISFAGPGASLFPRAIYNESTTWTPTSDYDLSIYKIFCNTDCGTAQYDLTGMSTDPPPPPVTGEFLKSLTISNSIGI